MRRWSVGAGGLTVATWWISCVSPAPTAPALAAQESPTEARIVPPEVDAGLFRQGDVKEQLPSERAFKSGPESSNATVDAAPPPKPRIGSISHYTWVYRNPSRRQQPIGYIRPGTSVKLKQEKPVAGSGCGDGKWMLIEPKGFVCADASTTLDLASPLFRALESVVKPRDHVLPYRYGYSTGAPMYGRIPSDKEIARAERKFVPVRKLPRSGKPRSGYEELAGYGVLRGTDAFPPFATPGKELPRMRGYGAGLVRKTIPSGSLLSFSSAFESGGRTYLLSTDLTLVPADRVRPFRETKFHGVKIDENVPLPIAWTRGAPRKKYRMLEDGSFEATGATWPPRTMLKLTGVEQRHKVWLYLETREAGTYVRTRDVSVVKAKTRLPWTVKEDDKWIEFSVRQGTFTLYVGKDPVFSTLASPGRGGGAPSSKLSIDELVDGSYTPLGVFRVTFKTKSTTMTPEGIPNPQKHWIQDVPYTQYFRRPFAIHTAYWHEDFGMPKSGGCINLSPLDARFVFGWTDPPVPDDWSGVSSSKQMGLGTPVVVRR